MDIASRIIELREKKNYSSNKLAKLAGIGQSTLSEIERGIKQPNIITLENICSALEISLSYFFSHDNNDLAPDISEIIDICKKLNPSQLGTLLSVAKQFLNCNE